MKISSVPHKTNDPVKRRVYLKPFPPYLFLGSHHKIHLFSEPKKGRTTINVSSTKVNFQEAFHTATWAREVKRGEGNSKGKQHTINKHSLSCLDGIDIINKLPPGIAYRGGRGRAPTTRNCFEHLFQSPATGTEIIIYCVELIRRVWKLLLTCMCWAPWMAR
jgi:hypothetical protein